MRTLVAFAVAGLLASAASGQVVIVNRPPLRAREKAELIDEARSVAHSSAELRELNGLRAWKGEPAVATLEFGPHSLEARAFSIDFVSCERPLQGSWSCRLDRTWRYVWMPPVVVEADVSEADAQRLIAAGFDATRPFVNPDDPLPTHYLRRAQKGWEEWKGEFVFDDGCSGVGLSIVDGAVKTGEKFGCIE